MVVSCTLCASGCFVYLSFTAAVLMSEDQVCTETTVVLVRNLLF